MFKWMNDGSREVERPARVPRVLGYRSRGVERDDWSASHELWWQKLLAAVGTHLLEIILAILFVLVLLKFGHLPR